MISVPGCDHMGVALFRVESEAEQSGRLGGGCI